MNSKIIEIAILSIPKITFSTTYDFYFVKVRFSEIVVES